MAEKITQMQEMIETGFGDFLKKVISAVGDYSLIQDKDKVLVAVSAGKDSLSALHFIDYIRRKKFISFDILACNVDLGYGGIDRKALAAHFKNYDIPFVFVTNDIIKEKKDKDIGCFWCSWNRRKALFETAKIYGCNKIVLGHHKDDIVETTLMNLMFRGEISTAPALVSMFGGEVSIIRPLCYVREDETTDFISRAKIKVYKCNCTQEAISKRAFIKNTFAPLFKEFPESRDNIYRALQVLKEENHQ
jgi:tRNA 2-thiocytidine biosynthesis protein TtcA